MKELRDTARRLGVTLVERPVRTPEEARALLANLRIPAIMIAQSDRS